MTYTRRVVEADVETLLPLCRAFHAESPVHASMRFDDAKVEQLIIDALDNTDWLAVVACDDAGEIVGMMLLYCMPTFYGPDLEVGDLTFYVAPQARGTRAALLMMKDALGWAKMKRATRLQLAAVTGIATDQVRRFFAKMKFDEVGVVLQRGV